MIGGVRSYPVKEVTSLTASNNKHKLPQEMLDEIAFSSACTLNRIESDNEWSIPEVTSTRNSFHETISITYNSALKWIEDNSLDAVICFNGRMEMTRAIISACESKGIPYITHERTWFGDGLTLIPNANCLSIRSLKKMVDDFDDKALTQEQARYAAKLLSLRFLQQNDLEWRIYNQGAESINWPLKTKGKKVLVLPSSRNESSGHAEWKSGWNDNTSALDDLFEAFSIKPTNVVVRFHPNWAENIGMVSGDRPLQHYTNWAKSQGIYFISSEEKANTYDLIQQADIVILNGGSSAVEAGVCGKQVICLGPSSYDNSGFVRTFMNKDDLYKEGALTEVEPEIIMRKTLRYVYLRAKRYPQFVDFVKAIKTTEYEYFDGADPQKIIDLLKTGELEADDSDFSNNDLEENCVIELLKNKEWALLSEYQPPERDLNGIALQRRFGLRWLDSFRAKLVRGDR